MQNLRIRCVPNNIFLYEPYLPLDTLIVRAVLIDKLKDRYYDLPTVYASIEADKIINPPDVPLEKRGDDDNWYYACSWALIDKVSIASHQSMWVRRFPLLDVQLHGFKRGRGNFKATIHKGSDKLYANAIHTRSVGELTWYAVGDGDEIRRLLNKYYTSIGKKTAYGYGQLLSYPDGDCWQIEPFHSDYSEQDGDGNLTRGIPVSLLDVSEFRLNMRRYAIRPPYHVNANQSWCMLP